MRFTDKAAAASLTVPAGLNPSVIGKVVTIQVFTKKNDSILPETLIKFVGVLKAYTLASDGMKFTLDGGSEKGVYYATAAVEVIPFEGS